MATPFWIICIRSWYGQFCWGLPNLGPGGGGKVLDHPVHYDMGRKEISSSTFTSLNVNYSYRNIILWNIMKLIKRMKEIRWTVEKCDQENCLLLIHELRRMFINNILSSFFTFFNFFKLYSFDIIKLSFTHMYSRNYQMEELMAIFVYGYMYSGMIKWTS